MKTVEQVIVQMRKFCGEHCTVFCYFARDLSGEMGLKDDQDREGFLHDFPASTPRLEASTKSAHLFLDACSRRPTLEEAIKKAEQHIPRPENAGITPQPWPDDQFFGIDGESG